MKRSSSLNREMHSYECHHLTTPSLLFIVTFLTAYFECWIIVKLCGVCNAMGVFGGHSMTVYIKLLMAVTAVDCK